MDGSKRRQGLLAVAVATSGPPRHIVADCPDCGEKLDLDVDLREFRLDWRAERMSPSAPPGTAPAAPLRPGRWAGR